MTDSGANNSKNNDDRVIITAIILGIGGGTGLLFLCIPAAASAFLFSLGGSAMLYRFLGGTSGSTLEVKGLKTTASAAILIAGTIGLNYLLQDQLKDPNFSPRKCVVFEPNPSSWIPIDKTTGLPISVKYAGKELNKLDTTDFSGFPSDLSLNKSREVSNKKLILGKLSPDKLKNSIFVDIQKFDKDNLHRSGKIFNGGLSEVSGIPFKIKVLCIKDCSAESEVEYQLLKNSNEVIGENRSIAAQPSREFQLFQREGDWYFITVSEYCKDPSVCPSSSPFVRFVVAKIQPTLKFPN